MFSPEGQYVLEITNNTMDETKSMTREETHRWLKEHDPEASFEEREKEAQEWLKDLPKEKKAA